MVIAHLEPNTKVSKLLNVDWGDDNQITNGINLRKSLARDYALNKLYATSGQ